MRKLTNDGFLSGHVFLSTVSTHTESPEAIGINYYTVHRSIRQTMCIVCQSLAVVVIRMVPALSLRMLRVQRSSSNSPPLFGRHQL